MKILIIVAISVFTLTSCEHAPYIMEGIAQGLAETSYQLEQENRRQWYRNAEINRINNKFRQGMYRRQHHDLHYHSDTYARNGRNNDYSQRGRGNGASGRHNNGH